MENKILITGATAGFGAATARLLAQKWPDARFLLTGRRKERLDALVKEIGADRAHGTAFDITDRAAVEKFAAGNDLHDVTILINNAGLAAGLAPFQEADIDDWEAMIDTNIKGLLYVTRAVLPHMIARKEGHIVNIGSVAGKQVYPNGHVYCATKFAVRALNEGLRLDTLGKNIRVTSIEPGMAETEFSLVRFKGDEARANSVYKGVEALSPQDVAEAIAWSLDRPKHVNIQEMLIMPTAQASARDVFRK